MSQDALVVVDSLRRSEAAARAELATVRAELDLVRSSGRLEVSGQPVVASTVDQDFA